MSLDVSLLQMMRSRKDYDKLHRVVNSRALDQLTATIITDFGSYFKEVPECDLIPVSREFHTFFHTICHPQLTPEQAAAYRAVFSQIEKPIDDTAKSMIMGRLLENNLAQDLADISERFARGEEINVRKLTADTLSKFEQDIERKVKLPFVPMDESLFDEDVRNDGFKWRWTCLAETMRPLRGGDFGILAGRPDKGKTTALTDLTTHWAPQLVDVYPDNPEKRQILWLNNEGPGKRILKRMIQSAFGCGTAELIKKQTAGTLWDEYEVAIGGDRTAIKVIDIHGFKAWQVEEIFKQHPPGLVIFDMVDNVRFDGELANGGTRTDQVLEAMYQWARDCAVRFDCPVLATSQISADGDGEPYPTLPMLKDSKTGKQGAADFIITLGTSNDPSLEAIRFIGTTKNKLRLEGQPQSPRAQMVMDATGGRYVPQ
ncbi:putative DNA helicase [Pseudomonas phage SoKa]|uniref:DNA helicase n=1 Tax=Pseudomonas phage SoKa TaxID=2930393 RepID=A0AAE9KFE0_9CAUD|nr:putative DNA helicase [Pseudomonas phage SoKa]